MTRPATATYQSLQDEILRRVRAREWTPGMLIPTEVDLAAEFGCARATMNRALRELADAGVLERKRRAGTRVALSPARRATLKIPVIRDEVEATGGHYSYGLIHRRIEPAPARLRQQFGNQNGQRLAHLTGLHLSDGAPFLYEDRWINPAAVPAIHDEPFERISPNEWLVREAPFSDGTIDFSAEAATPEIAVHLGVPPGTALFVVHRATWFGDTPITDVTMSYPPGYRLTSRL